MKTAREKFDRWIVASVALHVSVVLLVFVAPTLFVAHPVSWGTTSGTGGVNVKIVNGVPGIALPTPPSTATDSPNSESKSLYKSEPAPKTVAPLPDANAVKLPSKNASAKPEAKPAATKNTTDKPDTAHSNAVAYGRDGGSPALRYGQNGQGGPIGAEFGGGTFGTQFGAYVESMKRIIAEAWTSTQMSQSRSPRVYVTFKIKRSGEVVESQLEKPSDPISPTERAALQAIRRAKLQPLPTEYHGDDVAVRFYFDYVQ